MSHGKRVRGAASDSRPFLRKNGLFFNHSLDADGRRGPPDRFGLCGLSVRRRVPRPALPVRLSVPASVADLYNITLGDVNRPLVEREWEGNRGEEA